MAQEQGRPVCVVAGAGPGNGMAFARRFQAGGYQVVLLARDGERLQSLLAQETQAVHLAARSCDLTDAAAIQTTFLDIARAFGPVNTLMQCARVDVQVQPA